MHVAIAVVAFRNPDDVIACLDALSRSEHSDFQVAICENGGEAAYARLVERLPEHLPNGQRVQAFLAPSNLGYAGGVNFCVRKTPSADAWWVLNPDTAPAPQALAAMLARLGRGDCDAVGSVVHTEAGAIQSVGGLWRRVLARAVSLGYGQPLERLAELSSEVEQRQNYLNGASLLISRKFWEVAGPMREDYFLYCEEVEWCLRALRNGLRLGFAPDALVLHYQGTTTGHQADVRQQGRLPVYLNERNRLLLTRDLWPGLLPVAALMALGLIALRYARRGAWRQVGDALDGWRAGLRGERNIPRWMDGSKR